MGALKLGGAGGRTVKKTDLVDGATVHCTYTFTTGNPGNLRSGFGFGGGWRMGGGGVMGGGARADLMMMLMMGGGGPPGGLDSRFDEDY